MDARAQEAQVLARLARSRVRRILADIRELNRIAARLDDTLAGREGHDGRQERRAEANHADAAETHT